MYQRILVPVDLADPNLAKPALETAVMICNSTGGDIRVMNVLPMTPVMLAEYVPPDFEAQQRKSAEEALTIIAGEVALKSGSVTSVVRQGGIYQEILEEAKEMGADLIVMSSHRAGMRTYFLGSHAGHVVRYANCSVMVVRRP
jgi:nucleotide-binding universal stress UspA family protein